MSAESDHDILLRLDGDVRVLAQKVSSLHDVIRAEFTARDKALIGLAEETKRVREQQNEWRATVTDLAADKVDSSRYEERNQIIDVTLGQMREEMALGRGKTSGIDKTWALVLAAVGGAVGVIGVVIGVLSLITR